jgi:hypothetical protein
MYTNGMAYRSSAMTIAKLRMSRIARVLVCLSFTTPSFLHAEDRLSDYIADIGGSVESVEEDGSITLDGGKTRPYQHFVLWGLEISDIEGLRGFLQGRLLECKVVHLRGPLPEADCIIHPEKDGRSIYRPLGGARSPMSAFDWMTDLGFANQRCDPYIYEYYVSDGGGNHWFCSHEGQPDYGNFTFDEP